MNERIGVSVCRCDGENTNTKRHYLSETPIPRYPDTWARTRWLLNTPTREAVTIKIDEISGVKLIQPPKGVKASIDGILLARYVRPAARWRIADLGCGNGFVGLLISRDKPRCRVVGVEIQDVLIRQAVKSAKLNGTAGIRFIRADLRHPPWKEDLCSFDLVVANPPYRKTGYGRLSPDPIRAAARHELFGGAKDFAEAASALLRPGGSAAWVYLAERTEDLLNSAVEAGLEPVRFRYVVSRAGDPASLVLLESVKGKTGGGLVEEEPLILYKAGKGREYTDEARSIIYGSG